MLRSSVWTLPSLRAFERALHTPVQEVSADKDSLASHCHLPHLASYPKVGFRHCKFVILAYVWGTWFSKVKRAERRCKKRSGLKLEACRRVGRWRAPASLSSFSKVALDDLGFKWVGICGAVENTEAGQELRMPEMSWAQGRLLPTLKSNRRWTWNVSLKGEEGSPRERKGSIPDFIFAYRQHILGKVLMCLQRMENGWGLTLPLKYVSHLSSLAFKTAGEFLNVEICKRKI